MSNNFINIPCYCLDKNLQYILLRSLFHRHNTMEFCIEFCFEFFTLARCRKIRWLLYSLMPIQSSLCTFEHLPPRSNIGLRDIKYVNFSWNYHTSHVATIFDVLSKYLSWPHAYQEKSSNNKSPMMRFITRVNSSLTVCLYWRCDDLRKFSQFALFIRWEFALIIFTS